LHHPSEGVPVSALIKQQLLQVLDGCLTEHGFTRQSDKFFGDRYDRPIHGGRQSIAIASHQRGRALVLDPAFAGIRLDHVEHEVFRFEEKNELAGEKDVLWRNTIGSRLDKHELLRLMTGRWVIVNRDDCNRVGNEYARQMLRTADQFWRSVPTPEAILAKLAHVPGKARKYAGTDVIAAMRAIVLTRLLHGNGQARRFADDVLRRLPGTPGLELARWATRAFEAWGADHFTGSC
jgi:hypothetical protein